ncbi:MAG: twin transmembrane helix small protein [Dongiaceae bacterium]
MSGSLFTLLILAMLATLGVLFLGLFSMARGGEFNKKYGNKLMRARVLLQGAAVVVFVLLMLALGK